jgi:hypothetical protein
MTDLAAAIRFVPLPSTMISLPIDRRGFPVPWFVSWEDGEPDFRVIGPGKLVRAVREGRCWVCGGKIGRVKVSVIGPMCAINRVTSEPASHPACARYAAQTCPFLANPRMRRNEKDLPEQRREAPGIHLDRNPGVMALWASLRPSKPFRAEIGMAGVLFQLGPLHGIEWWARGRQASRAEVMESIESGLPSLREVAELEGNGAVEALASATVNAMRLLPA